MALSLVIRARELGKFVPARLSAFFRVTEPVVTLADNEDLWYYDWNKQLYLYDPKETHFIGKIKQMWGEAFKSHFVTPTRYDLKAATYIPREQFELEPSIIPLKNTILQIQPSGDISKINNSPDLYITNRIPVEYNPSAESKKWTKYLYEDFRPDDVYFLQEWIGSILYRKIITPKATMLVGPHSTGKSTFIYTIEQLFGGETGGNVISTPLQRLSDKFETVRLYKKLLNTFADIDSKALKSSYLVKTLISGDRISAQEKYKQSFDFYSYAKLLFSANEIPYVYDDTLAFYRR